MSSTEQASSPSATRKITSRYSVKRLVNSAQGLGARVVNSAPGFGALGSAQSGQPTSAVVNQGTHVPVSTQDVRPEKLHLKEQSRKASSADASKSTSKFRSPRTLRNEDSVTTSPKIAPAFVNSSAPQGLDQAKQQKQSAQHASTTKNTNPEVQELYTLQAELHRRLQHTDDPELRKQAQQVLHALNALQDTAQDPKTFAKEQKVQNGDALKDKEDYRKKDDSDEKALNMFGVGVSLLKSSMRSLDAITKQQRQQRYVAPWVKHQAMQDLAKAISLIEAAENSDPTCRYRYFFANVELDASARSANSARTGDIGVTELLSEAMSIIQAAQDVDRQHDPRQPELSTVSCAQYLQQRPPASPVRSPFNGFESCLDWAEHLKSAAEERPKASMECKDCQSLVQAGANGSAGDMFYDAPQAHELAKSVMARQRSLMTGPKEATMIVFPSPPVGVFPMAAQPESHMATKPYLAEHTKVEDDESSPGTGNQSSPSLGNIPETVDQEADLEPDPEAGCDDADSICFVLRASMPTVKK